MNLGFIILTITIRWISLYFYHHFNHNCSFLSQAIVIIVHFLYLNYDTDISFFLNTLFY